MRFVLPAIILSVAIIAAPFLWRAAVILMPDEGAGAVAVGGGNGVDSQARIDIIRLQDTISALNEKIERLEIMIANIPYRDGAVRPQVDDTPEIGGGLDYAKVVVIPGRRNVNDGLSHASSSFLRDLFGSPSTTMNNESCGSLTNETLKSLLVTESVGPIRVSVLKPAADSLREIFAQIRRTDLTLHDRIQSSGSLCVRLVRGSNNSASAHAYGLAIDINIDGQLDTWQDGMTQVGLIIVREYFKQAGWLWGAAFSREDSMHFEVSREKLEEWRAAGLL